VAELFEARRPKDHAIIAEVDGRCFTGVTTRTSAASRLSRSEKAASRSITSCRRAKHLAVGRGPSIKRGDTSGPEPGASRISLVRHSALKRCHYLIGGQVQKVYRLQGRAINDKHIGSDCRRCCMKVEIVDGGDTPFIVGEHIDVIDSKRCQ